ncbi:NHL repeat-containing protein [Flavobacterium caseinilyticum]|uniref:T9SS C-terminal target domain-containing protein n=1 Tax=Flavobacterium caseinilyticum TaxID=2541732 RepID=A0A4R5B1T3_9FLAO|nr:hypothetical protein [Flavobacterium caseinilyticum]TDD77484.1 hypothetical protein E0F89_07825 [Flavobacterium caseinilyticum]
MKKYCSILFFFALFACQQGADSLVTLYSLPKKLKEVSGIAFLPESNLIWAIEDSGNQNAIHGIDSKGKIARTITIGNTRNRDWEDITKDSQGNLYIGDFGNNDNDRKDLSIFKIDKKGLNSESSSPAYTISFAYPEQKEFPPKKSEMFYDVEGFFEFKNNFYLFTKNRSKGFDGTAFLYKVPNKVGFHQAVLLGEFNTCGNADQCAITSAAISPDESKVIVLTHDKILLFENFKGDDFLNGSQTTLKLNHFSQKEAICFSDNDTVFIADERSKKTGGKVYQVSLKTLKSKS